MGTVPVFLGTQGIDLLIGEARALGQGQGSAFVRRFTRQLLAVPRVGRVIADPVVAKRAVDTLL